MSKFIFNTAFCSVDHWTVLLCEYVPYVKFNRNVVKFGV